MATLQKFKLLATQCAVAGSPTRSPSASPVFHLRRRKTLRMLLSRPDRDRHRRGAESPDLSDRAGDEPDPPKRPAASAAASKDARARRKLRDLFVSSPPPPPLDDRVSEKRREDGGDDEEEEEGEAERGFLPATGSVAGGFGVGFAAARRRRAGSLRPAAAAGGFRYRFLRRAWRPVLVSIPE